MNLEELKALSRQIRPTANHHENIMLLSRNLRENLFRAKSRMMDSLKNSTEPQALQIYKDLTNQSTCNNSSITNTTIRSSGGNEDDCSSVSTLSSLQLRLVTDESGHVSVVSSDYQPVPSSKVAVSIPPSFTVDVKQDNFFVGQDVTCPTSFMSLYTPNYYPSMLDMELFLTNWPLFEKNTDYSQSTDVTEEQINSWLQRGGHNDTITMATDQELAGKTFF
ncbi:MAG: hypothetical protein EXX96DRAFT_482927 [Benjaminiella poitrasii]|nr:MAG: hypothetical protein EXX96DRAFT_482927 [Benjaminiella poitrasii]